jgi:hypothetical protein
MTEQEYTEWKVSGLSLSEYLNKQFIPVPETALDSYYN